MAIAFEGSASGNATNGGSITLTIPSSSREVGAYYLVAATVATSRTSAVFNTTVTTSSGGAYTKLSSEITSSSIHCAIFRRICLSTAETTITVTGTANASDSASAVLLCFDGIDATTPEDATATVATGASTIPNSPSITLTRPQCAVVTIAAGQIQGITVTTPSSPTVTVWSSRVTIDSNDNWDSTTAVSWTIQGTSAALDPGPWTFSTTASWAAVTVAIRPETPDMRSWPELSIPSDFRTEMLGY